MTDHVKKKNLQRRTRRDDLSIPTTPEKLAKAVMSGGAPRQKKQRA